MAKHGELTLNEIETLLNIVGGKPGLEALKKGDLFIGYPERIVKKITFNLKKIA